MSRGISNVVFLAFRTLVAALAIGAIASAQVPRWGIFVMQADGSGARGVARVDQFPTHGSPRWSHDDRMLAFDTSGVPLGDRKFFVVNADGSGLRDAGQHAMPDWSPDDKQLLYLQYGGQASTGVQNVNGQGRAPLVDGIAARWSPDGSQLVMMDGREGRLLIYDLVSETDRQLYAPDCDRIEPGFDWSPDGKHVACVIVQGAKRTLVIVNVATGAARVRLDSRGLEGAVSWSPDGKQLAVAIDFRIALLTVEGDAAPQLLPGQIGRAADPAWSHDGRSIAFSSDRPFVAPAPRAALMRPTLIEARRHRKGSIVYGMAFTPDGRQLVMGGDPESEGVQVWDLTADTTTNLGGEGIGIAMFPDGQRFATSWLSPAIHLVDLTSGNVLHEFDHGQTVRGLAVSPDGTHLVSAGLDRRLRVWNTSNGSEVCQFAGHEHWITRTAFTPNSKEVLSASQDHTLVAWNARTGRPRLKLEHPATVWAVAVSPDGRSVLTGTGGDFIDSPIYLHIDQGQENTLRLWDLATGRELRKMLGHTHAVYTADISPDGRWAVSGGWDGTLRLWDLESGEQLCLVEGRRGHVTRVLFSPDGKRVAVAGGVRRDPGKNEEFPDEQLWLYDVVDRAAGNAPKL